MKEKHKLRFINHIINFDEKCYHDDQGLFALNGEQSFIVYLDSNNLQKSMDAEIDRILCDNPNLRFDSVLAVKCCD